MGSLQRKALDLDDLTEKQRRVNSLNKSHISEFEFNGVKGAQGAKVDKGQAASFGVKYVR